MTDAACTEDQVGEQTHEALFYRDRDEYVGGVLEFLRPGLEAGDAVAIAVPPANGGLLRDSLTNGASKVEFLNMYELGRNPARIIPAVQAMLDRSERRLHYIGEPIWPGRSPEEIREATRHEALVNLAWPDAEIRVLCPYDASPLDPSVLADAERTHPYVVRDTKPSPSTAYRGPSPPPACEEPLSPPPPTAITRTFIDGDLPAVRALVRQVAASAGLSADGITDVTLAVNDPVTNAVKHARAPGRLRVWTSPGEIVCQVEGPGHIADPLAGRRRPSCPVEGGLGLWMVNQLCDLVEIRTGADGTTVRIRASAH